MKYIAKLNLVVVLVHFHSGYTAECLPVEAWTEEDILSISFEKENFNEVCGSSSSSLKSYGDYERPAMGLIVPVAHIKEGKEDFEDNGSEICDKGDVDSWIKESDEDSIDQIERKSTKKGRVKKKKDFAYTRRSKLPVVQLTQEELAYRRAGNKAAARKHRHYMSVEKIMLSERLQEAAKTGETLEKEVITLKAQRNVLLGILGIQENTVGQFLIDNYEDGKCYPLQDRKAIQAKRDLYCQFVKVKSFERRQKMLQGLAE